MDWKDEEVEQAWVAWRAKREDFDPADALNEAMRRVMTRAVKLAAARGGKMTAERWNKFLDFGTWDCATELVRARVKEMHDSAVALGARNAVLEAENERLKARCATLSAAGQGREWDSPESIDATLKATGEHIHRITMTQGLVGREQTTTVLAEYPCSLTCTHDDAATPGHPERVKERSEAMMRATELEPINALGSFEAYDRGAENMRAACLEAAQRIMQKYGIGLVMREDMKAAIEGAVP